MKGDESKKIENGFPLGTSCLYHHCQFCSRRLQSHGGGGDIENAVAEGKGAI